MNKILEEGDMGRLEELNNNYREKMDDLDEQKEIFKKMVKNK